jgi:hypothetical protein
MGNDDINDFVPFRIKYVITSENNGIYHPLQIETKLCSEKYDVSSHLILRQISSDRNKSAIVF